MTHDLFHPAVATWFEKRFGSPTEPQARAWPEIHAGRHTLIAAPTGSGKTLAAFLSAHRRPGPPGSRRRAARRDAGGLRLAAQGAVERRAEEPGGAAGGHPRRAGRAAACPTSRSAPWCAPATRRLPSGRQMMKRPPHILVTTPESLYILLTSEGGRRMLRTARTVIVDEIHAVADDKRGSHLALSLERLEDLCRARRARLTRIGLSATQKPIEEVARFLVGTDEVEADGTPRCVIVDAGHGRTMDLAIEVPGSPLEAVMPARGLGGDLRPAGRADPGAPHDPGLLEHPAAGRADHPAPLRPPGRGAGHLPPREPVEGAAAGRRAPAQGGRAVGPGGHGVAGAGDRHRLGRPGLPDRLDALDRHACSSGSAGPGTIWRAPQGADLPHVARRAGGVRGPARRGAARRARPADHPGEAARHPGAADRGGDGGRGVVRGGRSSPWRGAPGRSGTWSGRNSTRSWRCSRPASPPGGAGGAPTCTTTR